MLTAVLDRLRCPHCGTALRDNGTSVVCAERHSFDIARQGYLNLLGAAGPRDTDTSAMVLARAEFLRAGHFAPISAALAALAAEVTDVSVDGLVVDIGGGTGHHTARVLDGSPERSGLVVDISKNAARHAARAHPRLAAVVADIRVRVPLADGSAAVVLNVFAPRNGGELRRIVRPDGALLVVTPNRDHLTELVGRFGLLRVDDRKRERVAEQLDDHFTEIGNRVIAGTMPLDHRAVRQVIDMGPNAWHRNSDVLSAELGALPEPFPVTFSVSIAVYRPRPAQHTGSPFG